MGATTNYQSKREEQRATDAGHIASRDRDSCARCVHSEPRWNTRLFCTANALVVNKLDICDKFFRIKDGGS